MKPITPTAAALIACLLLPAAVAPQGAPEPGPGARIRFSADALGFRNQVGTLQDTTGGVWSVRLDGVQGGLRTWQLERSAISDVDVSVGSHRHALRGALIGALTVGGAMALLARAQGDDGPCGPPPTIPSEPWGWLVLLSYSCDPKTASEKANAVGSAGAVVGGVLGLAFGALARGDDWAPLGAPVTVAPAVRDHRRFGLAFRLPTR